MIILFSPFLLLMGLFIFISDGWPIIYSAKRVGKRKKLFTVFKFRTLKKNLKRKKYGLAEHIVINEITQFMRDTHLDEALQLMNVVLGQMSLIGPRPLDLPRYNYLRSKDPKWDRIFKLKPGMTCLNQIARYSKTGMNKIRKLRGLKNIERRNRLILDRYYISHECCLLDLKITIWTLCYLVIGGIKKFIRYF